MAHFARVNALTMKVDRVIVAEPEFIQTLPDYDFWIQTSYNTYGGQHPEGRPLRKNYAGIGSSALCELGVKRKHLPMGSSCSVSRRW
jgi:hypothetical protein